MTESPQIKMFRHLILCLVLVSNGFAQTALNSSVRSRESFAFSQRAALAASGFDSTYKLTLPKPVQDKNFYLLSLFQRKPELRKLFNRNKILRQLSNDRLMAWKKASACGNVTCLDELLRFSLTDIDAVATELGVLARQPQFKALVRKEMRPSGVFIKYGSESDAEVLAGAWRDAANGLNRVLSVYALGKDPAYKDIDRVSFDVSKREYSDLLSTKLKAIKFSKQSLFFEPTLDFALQLLEVNRRDEAARYEPIEAGENKAAVANFSNIKWSDYPYSFILVLGSGARDSSRLSPIGAKRAEVAARLYLEHKAPLIMMSGGHVHPMQTPYCEAVEMKKYVMEKFKIPASSILIEPHARHTTTNFRNGSRLALRFRLPANMNALVTSSEDHISYTASEDFRTRCLKELGYFPVEFIKRVSPVEAEFKPAVASLFFDSRDPLDP
jgi:DUF218 domain